jgi:hypothetical protein
MRWAVAPVPFRRWKRHIVIEREKLVERVERLLRELLVFGLRRMKQEHEGALSPWMNAELHECLTVLPDQLKVLALPERPAQLQVEVSVLPKGSVWLQLGGMVHRSPQALL